MKNRGVPGFYGRNTAIQAQRRYLDGGVSESQRVSDTREAAADVIGCCWLLSLNDLYGVGAGRYQKVMDAVNAEAELFGMNKRKKGTQWAQKELDKALGEHGDFGFLLPVVKPPRNRRDWELLSEQRDAAGWTVKLYIRATQKALGFGAERLERTVRRTEENFRHFGEYAESGDYYGYQALAQRLEQILHEPVGVAEEPGKAPVFGATLI